MAFLDPIIMSLEPLVAPAREIFRVHNLVPYNLRPLERELHEAALSVRRSHQGQSRTETVRELNNLKRSVCDSVTSFGPGKQSDPRHELLKLCKQLTASVHDCHRDDDHARWVLMSDVFALVSLIQRITSALYWIEHHLKDDPTRNSSEGKHRRAKTGRGLERRIQRVCCSQF